METETSADDEVNYETPPRDKYLLLQNWIKTSFNNLVKNSKQSRSHKKLKKNSGKKQSLKLKQRSSKSNLHDKSTLTASVIYNQEISLFAREIQIKTTLENHLLIYYWLEKDTHEDIIP